MADSSSEVITSSPSWGERLGASLRGVGFGIFLFMVGGVLLAWNEYNAVQAHNSLNEGMKVVVSLNSADLIDSSNEGKLVRVSWLATNANSTLTDSTLGVSAPNALKLKRNVEMYQWVQRQSSTTTKNAGGSTTTRTTYSYYQEWADHWIDSRSFDESGNHRNPSGMKFPAASWTAPTISLGSFTLPNDIVSRINWFVELNQGVSLDGLPAVIRSNETVRLYQDYGLYFGNNPGSPVIGDTRVTFSVVSAQQISIIAKQTASSFSPYYTSNRREILLVRQGEVSADAMFDRAHRNETTKTWLLRFLGFCLIWLGLQLVVQPLAVAFDLLPFWGDLVEGASCSVTGAMAVAISTVIIALSWLVVHPLLSLLILVGVGLLAFYVRERIRRRKATSSFDGTKITNSPENNVAVGATAGDAVPIHETVVDDLSSPDAVVTEEDIEFSKA